MELMGENNLKCSRVRDSISRSGIKTTTCPLPHSRGEKNNSPREWNVRLCTGPFLAQCIVLDWIARSDDAIPQELRKCSLSVGVTDRRLALAFVTRRLENIDPSGRMDSLNSWD